MCELPSVHVFRAVEVDISADHPFTMYADGDPIGELPLRVRAVRGAVSVLVPVDVAARLGVLRDSPPLPTGRRWRRGATAEIDRVPADR